MDPQYDENFDTFRSHILPRTCSEGILLCGSFYEQPFEYAMLNLTDLDSLFFDRTLIAAFKAAVISNYFHTEQLTIETNNCHLGFARLLRCREKNTEYYVRKRKSLHGPAFKKLLVTWPEVSNLFSDASKFKPNLKVFKELTADYVCSVLCPYWPPEADEWRTRKRNSGRPTRDMIEKVIADGCHLVPKSHQSNPNDDTSWRFSFSQAELILLNTWNEVQKYIYHLLRLLKSDVIAKCGGEKKTFLCTYNFKTLMLWACEEKPSDFWSEFHIEAAIEELLLQMIQWLIDKQCPNYFIRENNMLDYLQSDFDVSNEVLLLDAARHVIPTVIASEPKVYRGKMLHVLISDRALLLIQLAMNRRVFVNALNQKLDRYIVKNLSSSGLLSDEVDHLFKAVQLHRLLMSELSSGEVKISERRKFLETDALNYFQISYNKKASNNYSDVFLSSLDSISCTGNKFFYGTLGEQRQRMCCYRRSDKGNSTMEAMEVLCQTMITTMDNNHPNPSYFISAAYYANFYYTCLRDYRQASKICDEALASMKALEKVFSMDTFEPTFSNEILCVFINRQYIDIYDVGIQVVFGFLTLCMTAIKQNEKLASDRNLLRDLVLQVCPVEFLEYIRFRCRNELHSGQSDRVDDMKSFHFSDSRGDTGLRQLSNAILSSAICIENRRLFKDDNTLGCNRS